MLCGKRSSVPTLKLLEKIGERTRGASSAAIGEPSALAAAEPGYDPVAEP
jgi:hypothetical protein